MFRQASLPIIKKHKSSSNRTVALWSLGMGHVELWFSTVTEEADSDQSGLGGSAISVTKGWLAIWGEESFLPQAMEIVPEQAAHSSMLEIPSVVYSSFFSIISL